MVGPVCSSFCAKAGAIQQAVRWFQPHQKVFHFSHLLLFSDYRSVLVTLSSPPSLLLFYILWHIRQKLFSLFFSFSTWLLNHSFHPDNATRISLPKEECCFSHPQLLVVSLFLPLVSSNLFFPTGGVPFYQNFLTRNFLNYSQKHFSFFVTLVSSSIYDP